MGLIKKIFGGLFAFLGGLLGGVARIFGIGKGGGFYMELDEGEAAETSAAAATTSVAKAVASSGSATETTTAAQQSDVKPKAQKQAPEPATSTYVEIKRPLVLPRTEAELKTQEPTGSLKNFATDFLLSPRAGRSSRRRPGPSVSPFKEMAKQIGRQATSMG